MDSSGECCATCNKMLRLVKLDYSHGGCIHTDYEGFACLALACDGEVDHMVGLDPATGMCEMYLPRTLRDIKRGEI